MGTLATSLLGTLRVTLDGTPVGVSESDKARTSLPYLAACGQTSAALAHYEGYRSAQEGAASSQRMLLKKPREWRRISVDTAGRVCYNNHNHANHSVLPTAFYLYQPPNRYR